MSVTRTTDLLSSPRSLEPSAPLELAPAHVLVEKIKVIFHRYNRQLIEFRQESEKLAKLQEQSDRVEESLRREAARMPECAATESWCDYADYIRGFNQYPCIGAEPCIDAASCLEIACAPAFQNISAQDIEELLLPMFSESTIGVFRKLLRVPAFQEVSFRSIQAIFQRGIVRDKAVLAEARLAIARMPIFQGECRMAELIEAYRDALDINDDEACAFLERMIQVVLDDSFRSQWLGNNLHRILSLQAEDRNKERAARWDLFVIKLMKHHEDSREIAESGFLDRIIRLLSDRSEKSLAVFVALVEAPWCTRKVSGSSLGLALGRLIMRQKGPRLEEGHEVVHRMCQELLQRLEYKEFIEFLGQMLQNISDLGSGGREETTESVTKIGAILRTCLNFKESLRHVPASHVYMTLIHLSRWEGVPLLEEIALGLFKKLLHEKPQISLEDMESLLRSRFGWNCWANEQALMELLEHPTSKNISLEILKCLWDQYPGFSHLRAEITSHPNYSCWKVICC